MSSTSRLMLLLLCFGNPCLGQASEAVRWRFGAETAGSHEVTIHLSATIAPEWHLYSQYMNEGGPIPTRVSFEKNDDVLLLGLTEEKGQAVRYHDDIFDMDVTWYSGEVSFVQKARLAKPAVTVKGTLEYMVCSEHLCVPQKRDFTINIP